MVGQSIPEPTAVSPTVSLTDLFFAFNKIAVLSVGGSTAAWSERVLVEDRHWMTDDEFLEARSVAQILPGPNTLNLAVYIGAHFAGARGACAALLGLTTIPIAIVMTLGLVYFHSGIRPSLEEVFKGLGAAAAGSSFGVALKLGLKHVRDPLFVFFAVVTFILVGILRWSLIPVALGLAAVSVLIYWRQATSRAQPSKDS